jgi:hypothetical protein
MVPTTPMESTRSLEFGETAGSRDWARTIEENPIPAAPVVHMKRRRLMEGMSGLILDEAEVYF